MMKEKKKKKKEEKSRKKHKKKPANSTQASLGDSSITIAPIRHSVALLKMQMHRRNLCFLVSLVKTAM